MRRIGLVVVPPDGRRVQFAAVAAQTGAEQAQGLRGRGSMVLGEAMWFPRRGGPAWFTTEGMAFPIDMVFVGPDGRATVALQNVPPGVRQLGTHLDTAGVAEFPAGTLDAYGITQGSYLYTVSVSGTYPVYWHGGGG